MKNNKTIFDVFISYVRQDEKVAKSVNAILQQSGITTFFDIDDLAMGMEFATAITNAIRNCHMVIAIISESSLNSQWCRKEINDAFANGKPIVCILVGKNGQLEIPSDFQGLWFVDYDSLLDNPKQLFQIINESIIHKGEPTPPIPPNIGKQSNEHIKDPHSSKPVKSKKTWLKWMPIIVAIILASALFKLSPYLILVIALIVLIVLLVVSRRKIKQLSTTLNIVSDAKLLAQLGNEDKVIEKENNTSLQLPVGKHQMNLNYSIFNSPKRINCFIAGSTSLQTERDALRATISLVCNRWKEKNFQIFSFTYEDFERKFAPNGQQSLYDYFIENEANVAIFLIKGDVGDVTITEFEKAYKSFEISKHPSIIVYYDRLSELSPSAIELKNRVHSIGQYWVDFNTLSEMKYHFQEVLSTDLWTMYEKELLTIN